MWMMRYTSKCGKDRNEFLPVETWRRWKWRHPLMWDTSLLLYESCFDCAHISTFSRSTLITGSPSILRFSTANLIFEGQRISFNDHRCLSMNNIRYDSGSGLKRGASYFLFIHSDFYCTYSRECCCRELCEWRMLEKICVKMLKVQKWHATSAAAKAAAAADKDETFHPINIYV